MTASEDERAGLRRVSKIRFIERRLDKLAVDDREHLDRVLRAAFDTADLSQLLVDVGEDRIIATIDAVLDVLIHGWDTST